MQQADESPDDSTPRGGRHARPHVPPVMTVPRVAVVDKSVKAMTLDLMTSIVWPDGMPETTKSVQARLIA